MHDVSGITESSIFPGRILDFDWAATELGPAESWPQSLKSAAALVLHAAVPLILLWGQDGVMIYNGAYAALTGAADKLGRKPRDAFPELAGFSEHVINTVLAGGTLAYCDQQFTLERGGMRETVWLNMDYSPILDESGRPAGVLGIVADTTQSVLDMTARTRAEKALVEWNASLEQRIAERTAQLAAKETLIAKFFEYSSECYAIFTRDAGGAFRYEEVNPATLQIYQLSREQVVGRTLEEILEPGAVEIIASNLAACLADGQPRRYQRRLGEIVIEAVATPVPGEMGGVPRLLVSAHDATAEAAKKAALMAANKQLGEMATTDALTQINNRRGFDEALAREWSRARRLGTGIALLLFDIDEFKSFNDSQGHLKGDECLRRIAGCLRDNLGRASDFVARYGGEEFAVLLMDIHPEHNGGLIVAERLRQAVERLAIPHPASTLGYVTISGGVATAWPQPALRGSIEAISISIIREADAALYTAKYAGRNRVHGQMAPARVEPAKPRPAAEPPAVRRGRGRPRGTGRKMGTKFAVAEA
jgi:diguanylate cyclase (GGDEF)-like protein/PAS domain S-box-containing protein